MTGVNHHPADLPALVIKQEVLDDADAAIDFLDGASLQTGNGKHRARRA